MRVDVLDILRMTEGMSAHLLMFGEGGREFKKSKKNEKIKKKRENLK